MASSSGTSSGSTRIHNSGSEGDLGQAMDPRKRKRMISNRESARRSRLKKQNHLEELVSQASQLAAENSQILANVNLTAELFLKVDAENSVLRAQVSELTHRLRSLDDIVNCLSGGAHVMMDNNNNNNNNNNHPVLYDDPTMSTYGDDFLNPWGFMYPNQPFLGTSDPVIG